MNDLSKSLIPTKEENREILAQILQAQIEKPDPMNLPVAIFRAWTNCVVRKAFNRVEGEHGKASDELKAEMIKPAEQLGNEIDKTFERFQNEVEKAIKRFEDKINL